MIIDFWIFLNLRISPCTKEPHIFQIAIIFAILLAGMLLLAMVVGAIYFICVVNVIKGI